MATGKTVTVKNRIAVDNWTALEDLIQAPLAGGWFGEVERMQTLSRSAGWKFTGDETNLLFGDSDRIIREAATQESLVWQLPRLKNFAFTMYARSQQISSTVQIAVSADGASWKSTPYSTKVLEQSDSGWFKLSVESPAPLGDDVSLIRLTFTGERIAPVDLQLGHTTLNGLVEGAH
jgi:hypothetical protein